MGKKRRANTGPIVTFNKEGQMVIDQEALKSLGYDPDSFTQFLTDCVYAPDGLEKFCKFFLRESFCRRGYKKASFSKEQSEFALDISDPTIANGYREAYRGFGKTTLAWGEMVRRIVFRKMCFLVYLNSEISLAERRTEAIRKAITANPRIKLFFGNLKPQFEEGEKEVFGTKAWKLVDPHTNEPYFMCVPKSDETTVNGLLEYITGRLRRPDVIIVDDITDRLRVHDEVYRKKQTDWAFGTLFPCIDTDSQPDPVTHRWIELKRGDVPPWQIIVIDTCKHSHALIETVSRHPDFVGARYPMAKEDEEGNIVSLIDRLSDAQIQAIYQRMVAAGHEDRFYKEYMCRPKASKDISFPTEFHYYSESNLHLNDNAEVIRLLIMDPARTRNPRAAYTAILAVGINIRTNTIYLRRMVHAHLTSAQIEDALFNLAVQTNSHILGVEDAGLNDWIQGPLERGATSRGMAPMWLWIPTKRSAIEAGGEYRTIKEIRASSALWLYQKSDAYPQGHIIHEESFRDGPLESQQHSFPECKEWDAIDTLGHLDWMMRELQIFFTETPVKDANGGNTRSSYDELGDIINDHSYGYERVCA